jgi:hypothetical protein
MGRGGTGWCGSRLPHRRCPRQRSVAMRLSAVYACLRLLSEAISTLPTDTFYRQNGVRKPYRPRPGVPVVPTSAGKPDRLPVAGHVVAADRRQRLCPHPRDAYGNPGRSDRPRPVQVNVQRVSEEAPLRLARPGARPHFDLMHIKGMCLPGPSRVFRRSPTPAKPSASASPRRSSARRSSTTALSRRRSSRHPGDVERKGGPTGSSTLGTRPFRANAQKVGVLTEGRSSTRSRSSRTTHSSSRPGPSRCPTSPGSTASLRT